ncbi:hypothetical protein [Yersinia pestis]|nr:hypothetical protein [Yersinia pestis]
MIKQMRQQGAYIIDIATQVGCSERTVTNGAIVIHTQRLKSDPGGNLLS